jgi:rhamnosyltransferase
MWPEIYSSISLIPEPFDLFVTIPSFASTPELDRLISDRPNVRLFPAYNHGRDVLPFLKLLRNGCFDNYDAVCKLHTKRSPHMSDGDSWRKELIDSLLGDSESIRNTLKRFRDNPYLGIIGPSKFLKRPGDFDHAGNNDRWMKELAYRLNLTEKALVSPFFSGTMFWFNPAALISLKNLSVTDHDFPIEMGQSDGTPAHAIERLILSIAAALHFEFEITD